MQKMREKDLQKQIIDYLRLVGFLVVKFNSTGIYKKSTGTYIPQPQKGITDLLFWGKGKFGAIECKVKGNKLSPEQIRFGGQMTMHGGRFIVAYSLDDVMMGL